MRVRRVPYDYINQLYLDGLHRNAESTGLAQWKIFWNSRTSRETVAVDIALSPESQDDLGSIFQHGVFVPNPTDSSIARLYYGLLDRAPDASGLAAFEGVAAQGDGIKAIAQDILDSTEYMSTHGGETNSSSSTLSSRAPSAVPPGQEG